MWFCPTQLPLLSLNPSRNHPLHPHFQLLPQSATPTSIFFQLFWAALVSPGRRGSVVWSQPSPSSHTGTVTRGSCLPVTSWVEVPPIPLAQVWPQLLNISMKLVKGYVKWPFLRLFAKLLICKITQWPCSLCPIPQFRLVGVRTSCIFNISWTSWVLDPIINPSLGSGALAAACYKTIY